MSNSNRKVYIHKIWYSVTLFSLSLLCVLLYHFSQQYADLTPEIQLDDGAGLLSVTFLDVGEGDCALIETPQGQTVLIDTGLSEMQSRVTGYLARREVKKLDYLILTHLHEDHAGAAQAILGHLPVDNLILPNLSTQQLESSPLSWQAAIQNTSVSLCQKNTRLTLGDVYIDFLHDGANPENRENVCIVLMLEYEHQRFLFAGDCGAAQEKELIGNNFSLDCDVLKVGHHGSATSNSLAFLRSVSPEVAVISVGFPNAYGHPSEDTLERLTLFSQTVLRTDQFGHIRIDTDGSERKIWCQK